MPGSRTNYLLNLIKLARGQSLLEPLVVTYYVTTNCNLNCIYCEDFGARLNSPDQIPTLEDVKKILSVIRTATDSLVLTGGEPLTHPQIDDIVRFARKELGFRQITMLSNGLLLPKHESVLHALDRLVISIDSIDAGVWHKIIGTTQSNAQTILDNVASYASLQAEFGLQMVINSVLTPENLNAATDVLDFCRQNQLLVSFSPQALHNWPAYQLLVSDEFKTLIEVLIEAKKQGAPILGSLAYLETLTDFATYKCYPTTAPRVMPDGELIYPCRPVEKEKDSFGGSINLKTVNSWNQAIELLEEEYGAPPISCTSCYQQCYIEPSLMQSRPLAYLGELVQFTPSRKGSLATHTPG
jgi:MoaA/NifB/PqqE/SkfB family radical SAM enzyme